MPELTDFSKEPASAFDLYGPDARNPGTYAYNCLLARRLAERGVRFIQLYHRDWDHHGKLPEGIAEALQGDRPAFGGVDSGSEAARNARRHAGGLGRRVRPHRVLPGPAYARTITAAIIIRAVSRCGWRAAA